MEITYEIVHGDDIEQCRELCNELMVFQKSKATFEPERFDAMGFETRMKKSYENAIDRQAVIAKDGGVPIGYVFSTVESLDSMVNSPFHLLPLSGNYPHWIGCLSNLFLKERYRGIGLGSRLFSMAMEWLESHEDAPLTYIFISNGNEDAYRFYTKKGFTYSHDVLGGFIKAVRRQRSD